MRGRVFMILQAALCVLLCALLAAGAIGIYREGAARRAAGDAAAPIYTRQAVEGRLAPLAPLALATLGLAVAGLALGVGRGKDSPGVPGGGTEPPVRQTGRGAALLRIALLAAAVGFIVAGALNGSMRDVLYKAVNICTECVGLG